MHAEARQIFLNLGLLVVAWGAAIAATRFSAPKITAPIWARRAQYRPRIMVAIGEI